MGKQICVVAEDDPGNRWLFKRVLEDMGYEVFEFEDGEKAIAGMGSFPEEKTANVILTDLCMPCADGLQVIEFARKKFPRATVILSSACIEENQEKKAKELEAVVLNKPFHIKDLKAIIERRG